MPSRQAIVMEFLVDIHGEVDDRGSSSWHWWHGLVSAKMRQHERRRWLWQLRLTPRGA